MTITEFLQRGLPDDRLLSISDSYLRGDWTIFSLPPPMYVPPEVKVEQQWYALPKDPIVIKCEGFGPFNWPMKPNDSLKALRATPKPMATKILLALDEIYKSLPEEFLCFENRDNYYKVRDGNFPDERVVLHRFEILP